MKIKIAIVMMVMILAGAVLFAGGSQEKADDGILIGISKIVVHPALDALEQGIVEVVSEEYPDAEFDLQNANGEMSTASSIARRVQGREGRYSRGNCNPDGAGAGAGNHRQACRVLRGYGPCRRRTHNKHRSGRGERDRRFGHDPGQGAD